MAKAIFIIITTAMIMAMITIMTINILITTIMAKKNDDRRGPLGSRH
jgi:hypothetical protein